MPLFKCKNNLKKGSLFEMTSNNTPAPYEANRGHTNVSVSGEPYTVFRSEGGSVTGSLVNAGDQAYCALEFNKIIKIKKIHYSLDTGYALVYVQYKDENGNFIPAPTLHNAGSYEDDLEFSTPIKAQCVVLGVRKEWSDRQCNFELKQLIVTEWR